MRNLKATEEPYFRTNSNLDRHWDHSGRY